MYRKYSKNSFDSNNSSNNGYAPRKYRRERFNSEGNSKLGYNYYNYKQQQQEEIEIDISKIKYSLTIEHKYPLESIKKVYNQMKEKKILDKKPDFKSIVEIIGDNPKEIQIFKNSPLQKQNINIKLPKNNPLSNFPKNFNKFDMIPQENLANQQSTQNVSDDKENK